MATEIGVLIALPVQACDQASLLELDRSIEHGFSVVQNRVQMTENIARKPRMSGEPEGQSPDAFYASHITRYLLQPAERDEMRSFDQVSNAHESDKKCNRGHHRASDQADYLPSASK